MSQRPAPIERSPASTALLAVLLALAVLVAAVAAVGWPARVRVASPRLGMPAIDRPAATLEVRLQTSLPFILPQMHWALEGSAGTAALPIAAHRWEAGVAVLSMRIPDLPDGGYALTLHTAQQSMRLPQAVFVRRDWPHLIRIAHIADLPPPGREPLMRLFVREINRRHPDAVLVTGDINYTGSESNIEFIAQQLAQLDAPVVMTAGNHEREAWHRYLRVFGARDHRTDLGPLAILSLDSNHGRDALTPSALGWLQTQLENLGGRTPIIQLHHPVFAAGPMAGPESGGTGGYLRGQRQAFLELCRRFAVPLVLSGHWHQDAVFDQSGTLRADRVDFPGTKYVVTTALGAEARNIYSSVPVRNGYRWIEFTDGALTLYGTDAHNPIPSTPLENTEGTR